MKIKTTRRRALVRITSKQMHQRNHIPLANGFEIEIIDSLNPNNWSVEEAIVEAVPQGHTFFAEGDRVLIDFSVVTAGMYPEMQMTSVTRVIEKTDDYLILWCYCGADESSATEIHAKIIEEGGTEKLVPFPGTIIFAASEKTESFKQQGLLYLPTDVSESREKNFKTKVLFSGIPEVKGGETVWVKGGYSIPVNSGKWKVEYVDEDNVLAVCY